MRTKNDTIYAAISDEEERIGKSLIDAAFTVHKYFGPGLLEKVYEISLAHELQKRGFTVSRQVEVPVVYDGIQFEDGLRLDLLIENKVICEVKALENVNPVWEAQVLSQLKLTGHRLGYLINFNVPLIKNGIRRLVL
ncbi:MAG: GxxExxY protein [Bacteroidetes bacterium]|jgi:GxxExxY protein|nr:GxxExxY protein [Bacteroidota bacterium]